MQYLTPLTLLAATLAVAVPTNKTFFPRDFQGSINWFNRWDCTNPCVENGYCLSGQVGQGMEGSEDPWIGWDGGCWDRPDHARSLALSVSNGHKFTGIDKPCAQFKKDNYVAVTHELKSGGSYGDDKCNVVADHDIRAVFYHW